LTFLFAQRTSAGAVWARLLSLFWHAVRLVRDCLRLWRDDLVPGWASTIVVVDFLSGMNMLVTGIVDL
jgi:hypothetical protein